jgi:hypothetical protein
MPQTEMMFGSVENKSSPMMFGPFSGGLLLDKTGSAAAAFSLRRLRSNYTGNCIRVRRSSDNTELDIKFGGDGVVDTSTLLNFVGSGNGFVSVWWDQSENGRNASNGTASRQPRIVTDGVLEIRNNRPAMRWYQAGMALNIANNAAFNWNSTKALSIVAICSLEKNFLAPRVIQKSASWSIFGAGSSIGYSLLNSNGAVISNSSDAVYFNDICTGNMILHEAYLNKNIMAEMFHNGTFGGRVSQPTGLNNSAFTIQIGNRDSLDRTGLGHFAEVIIYPTDQSYNKDVIRNNLNSHYNIY